jgi:hypothetical protein
MTPREVFEDTFRIAELLIQLYRLLENDHLETEGERVEAIRRLLRCSPDEQIQVLANEVFLGCIRENANIPPSRLKKQSLEHLLRQAVVSACTAYETYLSALLKEHLLTAITVRQSEAFPTDPQVAEYFKDLRLEMQEAFRLLNREDAILFLCNKILTYVQKNNLGSVRGLKTVGLLLGLPDPWNTLAAHLKRERKDLTSTISGAIERRNAIVHKADRDFQSENLDRESISYSWAKQAVSTIESVCLGFDELIEKKIREYEEELAAREETARHA